jgi:magnesium and cobalt transporter
VSAVNEAFGVALPEEDFDTIGGLVADQLGRVPRRGEAVQVQGLSFSVMLTRGGAVRWFKVSRAAASAEDVRAAEPGGPPAAPPA